MCNTSIMLKKGDHIPLCCGKLMEFYDELFITIMIVQMFIVRYITL